MAAKMPDLSFVVVTHNRCDLALQTIETARRAVRELDVEWLVVDSESSDGTPAELERAWPDVEVMRGENAGFAAANNRALEVATGRYVLLLNPDVETIEGTYDELIAVLDERPEIGMASVLHRAPDGELQLSIRRWPSPWLALGEALSAWRLRPLRRWREEEPRAARYRSAGPVDWVSGAFLIARREVLEQIGGLDDRFFLYSEEIDWCYRCMRAGYQVAHLPVMTIVHHTGDEPRPDLAAQLSYAKILFARKHYGGLRAAAIHLALALRHALRASAATAAARARPRLKPRAQAERHALAVVLGRSEPPFAELQPTGADPVGVAG